jgi:hypothetical protein
MGLKPPNPPHPLATVGPSPGVLDAGHNNSSSEAKHQHGHLAATVCCSRNYWKPNSGSSEVCQAIFYAMCMLFS